MKAFRTVLHGTCLLRGKHPPGSQLARECPVLQRARRQAAKRLDGGQAADAGASGQPGPGQSSPALYSAPPTSRWARWQAQQIARYRREAWRERERDRLARRRARKPPA